MPAWGATAETSPVRVAGLPAPPLCVELAASPWPPGPASRRLLIQRLQAQRSACIEYAPLLALLGGLLLEEGDAAQALVWLERALLLDPDQLGAQADHALALADLGQPEALQALVREWRDRPDVPPALQARLYPEHARSAFALPPARLGGVERRRWGWAADLSWVLGTEDNLDRSPRLTELALTIPDGVFVLPLVSQPRSGSAGMASGSVQWAFAPDPAWTWRVGAAATSRSAPRQRDTDWQQAQLAASLARQQDGWRWQLEAGTAWFGGRLSEPYRQQRMAVLAEWVHGDCRSRVALEGEQRQQSQTRSLDALAWGGMLHWQCAVALWPGQAGEGWRKALGRGEDWTVGLFFRSGQDRPEDPVRPGGTQRLGAWGLRLSGRLPSELRVELGLRQSSVRDSQGYSELLQRNAVRRLKLAQWSVDLHWPLPGWGPGQAEAVLQWQQAAQRSNLEIFQYRANSLYGGLRWSW